MSKIYPGKDKIDEINLFLREVDSDKELSEEKKKEAREFAKFKVGKLLEFYDSPIEQKGILDYTAQVLDLGKGGIRNLVGEALGTTTPEDWQKGLTGEAPSISEHLERAKNIPSGPEIKVPYTSYSFTPKQAAGLTADVATEFLSPLKGSAKLFNMLSERMSKGSKYASAIKNIAPKIERVAEFADNPIAETGKAAAKGLYSVPFIGAERAVTMDAGKFKGSSPTEELFKSGYVGTKSGAAKHLEKEADRAEAILEESLRKFPEEKVYRTETIAPALESFAKENLSLPETRRSAEKALDKAIAKSLPPDAEDAMSLVEAQKAKRALQQSGKVKGAYKDINVSPSPFRSAENVEAGKMAASLDKSMAKNLRESIENKVESAYKKNPQLEAPYKNVQGLNRDILGYTKGSEALIDEVRNPINPFLKRQVVTGSVGGPLLYLASKNPWASLALTSLGLAATTTPAATAIGKYGYKASPLGGRMLQAKLKSDYRESKKEDEEKRTPWKLLVEETEGF